ncbi:MAG TPA: T9SS type A sorting domain-containing protein [Saprospiraceae bacterium]|jgi:type IX secretion system substrate protein
MKLLITICLCMTSLWASAEESTISSLHACKQQDVNVALDIDSTDIIIIDMDHAIVIGQYIEVPVIIQSDEVINALDFSMLLNIENLEYESVIDHTSALQYAAHFNTDDLKLRFTSNSFSSYPMDPEKVVSIRFRVLSGAVFPSDIQSFMGYLNGDRCKVVFHFSGEVLPVSNKEIIINEIFITPNPVMDEMIIQSDENGTLDLFDLSGKAVLKAYEFFGGETNLIHVDHLPNGCYTARVITSDQKVKTQQIIIQ